MSVTVSVTVNDPAVGLRLSAALDAARGAGEILLRHWGKLSGYELKGAVDPVSRADRESEAFLRDRLVGAFPDDGFVGEEGMAQAGASGFRWVADPLDGTTNFVHGHPIFAVSIAVERDREFVAGCIHVPVLRETFHAARGGGAFLDGRPIHVSNTSVLGRALVATGFPYNQREVVDDLVAKVRAALGAVQGLRRVGAAAVDLAYLAAGRLDGYWEQGLAAWDVAAGQVIVEEAGGRVTDWAGGPHDPWTGPILASNGVLHERLKGLLFG